MQFKIGQQVITIMNMFNIFVQHTITLCKYHPPCRQVCPLHFYSTNYTINLCHDLNSNAFLNLDASLSHSSMNVPGIAKLHVLYNNLGCQPGRLCVYSLQ